MEGKSEPGAVPAQGKAQICFSLTPSSLSFYATGAQGGWDSPLLAEGLAISTVLADSHSTYRGAEYLPFPGKRVLSLPCPIPFESKLDLD